MENKRIIQVDEKVPFKMLVPLSIQHMFAMFGASVLVPFVFGINPAVVLFMNGLGNHEGESTGISWFKFRVSCTGRDRYLKMGIQLCTGRLCCSRILWMYFIPDYL